MKLGVIGSGNIGKAIGSWAAKLGYEVTFSPKNEAGAKAALNRRVMAPIRRASGAR